MFGAACAFRMFVQSEHGGAGVRMAPALNPEVRRRALRRQVSDTVELANESQFPVISTESPGFRVVFAFMAGPADTPYEGGVFAVKLEMDERFPYASPSVGFCKGSIPFHPNINDSGSVCVDVLGHRKWKPVTRLDNIVHGILPLLLQSPNEEDPLNRRASHMFVHNPDVYLMNAQRLARTQSVAFFEKHERPAIDESFALEWVSTRFPEHREAGFHVVRPTGESSGGAPAPTGAPA